MTPDKVWVFYPNDGGTPVLWTKPCPFPHDGEAERVEYVCAPAPDVVEALRKAVDYFGAPSDGSFDGMDDDDAVNITVKVRVGDIKEMRAALAPRPPPDADLLREAMEAARPFLLDEDLYEGHAEASAVPDKEPIHIVVKVGELRRLSAALTRIKARLPEGGSDNG